jgi:hypothetical protein
MRNDAMAKRANLDSLICVESELALFAKSLEVTSSKSTVCLPATVQI